LTYVYIYVIGTTNHHCMYPQIVSMLIHRMIMLTTTYYVPTTSPSSSATMQLKLEKKKTRRTKKILTRGSWGLSPPAPPSYSLSLKRGNIFLPKSNSRNKAKWVQCWLLLSEEFQREWMDQLTLVHHITTLGDSTAFSSANRHNKPSHAGLRSRRSSSAVQGTRVRICAQTCTSRCRWTS